MVPFIAATLSPLPGLLTRLAIIINTLTAIDMFSAGWTRRRAISALALFVVGIIATGLPQGAQLTGWALAAGLTGLALVCAYVFLLRADLTLVVPALGVMVALGILAQGLTRPYPAAFPGSLVAALLAALMAWWCFGALRRARTKAAEGHVASAQVR
jgi:hypothetical protein